jgi:ABC-type transport system involved in multi-copper enzyme maturation permease subunit
MTWRRRFVTLLGRELRGGTRNKSYLVLALSVAAVAFGAAIAGSGPEVGYVPTIVDLLVPVEVLVPAVAFVAGYRAIVDDARRGELTVLATYPVPAWMYVGAVYLGRLAVVLGVVLLPLGLVGVYVAVTASPDTTVFATHQGIDSPVLFVRFLALTGALAATTLAVALAVSAFAASRRRAIILGLVGLVVVVAGADLALFGSLSAGVVDEGILEVVLAVSPTSAYRGLVFETVVSVAFDGETGYVAPGAAVAGLLLWTAGSLAVATVGVTRDGG